ncbi:MAG: hypothetical protein AAFP13_09395 [Pseudomonadota bacterium]
MTLSAIKRMFSGARRHDDEADTAREAPRRKRLSFKEKLQRDPFERLAQERDR